MLGTLILVRHGESLWNKDNLFCGWVDIRLSTKGEEQAKHTANLIKQYNLIPEIVYTSKLTRANQTTNIILDELDLEYLDISKTWRLNERHYGSLQGHNKSEVLQKYGEEKYMYWRRAYEGCPPLALPTDKFYTTNDRRYELEEPDDSKLPKAESLKMTMERLIPYYKDHIESSLRKGRTVLVVTHGSIVRALLKHLFEISDDGISKINVPNGIPLSIEMKLNENDELKPNTETWTYLDPERAKIEAEKVARQGFEKKMKENKEKVT